MSAVPSPSSLSFTQGVILGQLTIVLLGVLLLKYLVFEHAPPAQKKRAIPARRVRPTGAPPSLATVSLLSALAYDLSTHAPETLDWVNLLAAQTVMAYRSIIELGQRARGARAFMEEVLNRRGAGADVDGQEGEGLMGVERIRVKEVELGERFPVFSNVRVRPSGETGGTRIDLDVDYTDRVHLSLSTSLLVNFPRPRFAVLPISLGLTLEHFSGTITLELPPPNALLVNSPSLHLSLHPDFTLDLSTTSLLGSRAKLQDIPKVEQLILARIRSAIMDRVVWPARIEIGLPSLFPPGSTSPGPDEEEDEAEGMEWEFVERDSRYTIQDDEASGEADEDDGSYVPPPTTTRDFGGSDLGGATADGGPSIELRTKTRRRPVSMTPGSTFSIPLPSPLPFSPQSLSSSFPNLAQPSPTSSLPGHLPLPPLSNSTTFPSPLLSNLSRSQSLSNSQSQTSKWTKSQFGTSTQRSGTSSASGGLRYRTAGSVGVGVGMSPAASLRGDRGY